MQSEVRSIVVLIHVGCDVHIRPVDYVEVHSVGCKVVVASLTGRMQRVGSWIFILIHIGGSSIFFFPTLYDVVMLCVRCTHSSHVLQLRVQGVIVDIIILVDVGSPMHIPV